MSRVGRSDLVGYWLLHGETNSGWGPAQYYNTRRACQNLGRVFVDLSGKVERDFDERDYWYAMCRDNQGRFFRDTCGSTSFTTSLTPLPFPDVLSLVCVQMLSLLRCRLLGINMGGSFLGVVIGRCALTTC